MPYQITYGDRLTILSCGMGRDSIAMICLLIERKLTAGGFTLLPANIAAVVFSDTGAEWPHTYAAVPRVKKLCDDTGIQFIILEKGGSYHKRPAIIDDYMNHKTICTTVSAACTANHKILPIRRYINQISKDYFNLDNRAWSYAVRKGTKKPHRILIGITADEKSRAAVHAGPHYQTPVFPLIEMGITKEAEAAILARHDLNDIRKSGCMHCPYQPVGWFWVVRERHPSLWAKMLEYERLALSRNQKMYVTGNRPLDECVSLWRSRNPAATVDDILNKTYHLGCAPAEGQFSLFQAERTPT